MPVRGSRSSGGGGGGRSYRGGGGGGGVGGLRGVLREVNSRNPSSWKEHHGPTMVIVPRSDGSGNIYRHSPPWEGGEVVYNRMDRESRWRVSLIRAKEECAEDPKSDRCQMWIELLVDAPPGTLEEHGLPQLLRPDRHINDPPLKVPDPPPTSCDILNRWLQSCRDLNTHYDARWKCVPFEVLVEDGCPQKA